MQTPRPDAAPRVWALVLVALTVAALMLAGCGGNHSACPKGQTHVASTCFQVVTIPNG